MWSILNALENDPNEKKLNDRVISLLDYSIKKVFSTY